MRLNLDPFSLYSDRDVWRALDHAHLKAYVSNLPGGLHFQALKFEFVPFVNFIFFFGEIKGERGRRELERGPEAAGVPRPRAAEEDQGPGVGRGHGRGRHGDGRPHSGE